MTTSHTPQWHVDTQGAPTVRDSAGNPITSVPTSLANARLIAAAPELLAALEALLDWVDPYAIPGNLRAMCNTVDAATAAIARAKGEA